MYGAEPILQLGPPAYVFLTLMVSVVLFVCRTAPARCHRRRD